MIGVVIVSYRSHAVLPGLLQSLAAFEPAVRVVVVDNASPGGPPQVEAPVRLVVSERNHGFGTGCNRGAAELLPGQPDYICFLNPDVRLTAPSLSELAAALDRADAVGVATTPLVDADRQPLPSAWGPTSSVRALWAGSGLRLRRLRRWVGFLLRRGAFASGASTVGSYQRRPLDVDGHVVGGAMMVRRACWEQLGGFDEGYFMFWEDADLCLRAREMGWRIAVVPVSPLVHIGASSSEGITEGQRWEWYVQGARRFARLHLQGWHERRLLAALRVGRLLRARRRA